MSANQACDRSVCHSVNRITVASGNRHRPKFTCIGKGWPSRSDQLLMVIHIRIFDSRSLFHRTSAYWRSILIQHVCLSVFCVLVFYGLLTVETASYYIVIVFFITRVSGSYSIVLGLLIFMCLTYWYIDGCREDQSLNWRTEKDKERRYCCVQLRRCQQWE